MGLLRKDHTTACVGTDMWESPATIPLGGIKSPLTIGLFTAPPTPTNAHEKPLTTQPLLDVLHGEELEGYGYQSCARAGMLRNKQKGIKPKL